ncbi:MAG: hypothetical protein IPN19_01390 [Elusimicrobia bacterium]|nr:hypothetical protein [Elusimicrobiota bacterium]
MNRSWFVRIALVVALWMGGGVQAAPPVKRVLLLFSHHRLNPTNLAVHQAFQSRLSERFPGQVEQDTENIDITNAKDPLYENELFEFLKNKYASRKPDAIVAVTPVSYKFARKNRKEFFPNVPLVGCLVRPEDLGGSADPSVISAFTHKKNLEAMLRLMPRLRTVYIVGGDRSSIESSFLGSIQRDAETFKERVAFRYLVNVPPEELNREAAHFPADSAVYYYFMGSDRNGMSHIPRDVLAGLARSANAPVFSGVTDSFMGAGVVGGYMVPLDDVGRLAADIVIDLLGDQGGGRAPVSQSVPSVPIFDARQIRRWGFSEDALPPGSRILFRPPSFWDEYRAEVFAVVFLIIMQGGLILFLWVELKRRQKAEHRLKDTQREVMESRTALAHATRVSTLGALATTIAHEINQPLSGILSNAQAALRFIDSGKANPDEMRAIFTDIVKDDQRAAGVIRRVRALVKKGPPMATTVSVNDVVEEVLDFMKSDLRAHHVRPAVLLAPGLPTVIADPVQLQQVFLNLILNGIEAMNGKTVPKRVLTIETGRDGSEVWAAVRDRGDGIATEKLKSVFEPFSTTKPNGLGLGLSVCVTIVTAHGGRIWAEPNLGGGAVFHVALPIQRRS